MSESAEQRPLLIQTSSTLAEDLGSEAGESTTYLQWEEIGWQAGRGRYRLNTSSLFSTNRVVLVCFLTIGSLKYRDVCSMESWTMVLWLPEKPTEMLKVAHDAGFNRQRAASSAFESLWNINKASPLRNDACGRSNIPRIGYLTDSSINLKVFYS